MLNAWTPISHMPHVCHVALVCVLSWIFNLTLYLLSSFGLSSSFCSSWRNSFVTFVGCTTFPNILMWRCWTSPCPQALWDKTERQGCLVFLLSSSCVIPQEWSRTLDSIWLLLRNMYIYINIFKLDCFIMHIPLVLNNKIAAHIAEPEDCDDLAYANLSSVMIDGLFLWPWSVNAGDV